MRINKLRRLQLGHLSTSTSLGWMPLEMRGKCTASYTVPKSVIYNYKGTGTSEKKTSVHAEDGS